MRITPYAQMAEVRFESAWGDTHNEYDLVADTYWQLTALSEDIDLILADYPSFDARTGLTKEQLIGFADDVLRLRQAIFAALADPESYFAERKLVAPSSRLNLFSGLANDATSETAGLVDVDRLSRSRNLGELARQLSAAFPMGNPTLLMVNLPIPAKEETEVMDALTAAKQALEALPGGGRLYAQLVAEFSPPAQTREGLQRAVVDRYIVPIARRACERDPTDRDCMTRAELKAIAGLVPVREE
jgi:hypothetical protein